MPADLLKRINLDLLFPPFLETALMVLAECRAEGADYYGIRGFATYAEQDDLFAQGRSKPGPIVTAARGGFSAHNFGLALDLARDVDITRAGLQPTWAPGTYDALGRVAEKHGLIWGGHFSRPDSPHIQWPGFVNGADLAPLRAIFAVESDSVQNRLKQVWDYVSAQHA